MPVTNDHDWLIHFTTVQNNPWKYDEIKTKKSKMALQMKIKTNYQKKIRSKNRTISSKTSEERCYGAIPPPPPPTVPTCTWRWSQCPPQRLSGEPPAGTGPEDDGEDPCIIQSSSLLDVRRVAAKKFIYWRDTPEQCCAVGPFSTGSGSVFFSSAPAPIKRRLSTTNSFL